MIVNILSIARDKCLRKLQLHVSGDVVTRTELLPLIVNLVALELPKERNLVQKRTPANIGVGTADKKV